MSAALRSKEFPPLKIFLAPCSALSSAIYLAASLAAISKPSSTNSVPMVFIPPFNIEPAPSVATSITIHPTPNPSCNQFPSLAP